MISRLDGEVSFADGLVIRPHMPRRFLPGPLRELVRGSSGEWVLFALGERPSAHGDFQVEVGCATADEHPVFLVVLSSVEPFFDTPVEGDRERWIFHEGVLARELSGQREFAWGEAFCKYSREDRRNYLNVVYTAGPKAPPFRGGGEGELREAASRPEGRTIVPPL
jgi:hypothetical protein